MAIKVVGRRKQADAQIGGAVNFAAVDFHRGVADSHHQLAHDHAFHVDTIGHHFGAGQYLAEVLDLAGAERAAVSRAAFPAEEKTDQLPHGVETETARHDRVGFEMAFEKPQVGIDVELGDNLPLSNLPPSSVISMMRSNISIGGSGSSALPGPNSFPLPQSMSSS